MNESIITSVQGIFKSPLGQHQASNSSRSRMLPSSWSYENLSSMPHDQLLDLLKQIPGMLEAKTISVNTILSSVIKLCASNNFQIKEAVCEVLVVVAEGDATAASEIGLLVGNILVQDLVDANPSVRATAISAICSISVLSNQYAFQAISNGLKDSNPKVRKSAVVGCGKVWRHSPQIVAEYGLIDILYTSVRDTDPNVMTFAMQTLNIILESEGGIVINQNMAGYLLQRLNDCPEVERVFVMDYLHLFKPENDMACIKVFNVVDAFLDDKNAPVVLSASKLFYAFINHLKSDPSGILRDFMIKISPQIARFLKGHGNQDFQHSVMMFLTGLSDGAFEQLLPLLNQFYFKPKDNVKSRKLKAQILFRFYKLNLKKCSIDDTSVAKGSNANVIVDYLLSQLQYQTSIRDELVSYICQAASLSAENYEINERQGEQKPSSNIINKINQTFVKIMTSDDDTEFKTEMTKLILIHIRNLPIDFDEIESKTDFDNDKKLVDQLCRNFLKEKETMLHQDIFHNHHQKDDDDLETDNWVIVINFFWLLHTYANKIKDCPYILEEVVDLLVMSESNQGTKRKSDNTNTILSRLLTTSVKCFQFYPAECQHILGKVFELCKKQNNPDLDEKVIFYSKLLQCDSFYKENWVGVR